MISNITCASRPTLVAQRQRFCAGDEVDAGQQVVDELGLGRVADGLADDEALFGQIGQQRLPRRQGRGPLAASMMLIVPASARPGPPEIGASMVAMPCGASRSAKLAPCSCGAMVEHHNITVLAPLAA